MGSVYISMVFLCVGLSFVEGQVPSSTRVEVTDSTVYLPGYFTWNENTVIRTGELPSSRILQYQSILDHSNTDFSDNPESVILIKLGMNDSVGHPEYSIKISQDTIIVRALSEITLLKGLDHLRNMKRDAENDSPDYGLLYLPCGLYYSKNF